MRVVYCLVDADVPEFCELMCRRIEHEATSRLQTIRRDGLRQ
jgi:hypothetical protein